MSSNAENYTIRPYIDADLETLLTVWEDASSVGHPFLSAAFLAEERRNLAVLYLPQAETWVCEQEGEILGFLSLAGNEIGGLFVASAHQRRGVGRALVDKARELRGELEVEVFADNRVGRAFYAHYGFVPVSSHIHAETGFELLRLRLARGVAAAEG